MIIDKTGKLIHGENIQDSGVLVGVIGILA